MELPDLNPGRIKCLKCRKEFDSIDRCTNRICPKCDKENSKEYQPRKSSSQVYSGEPGNSVSIED